MVRTLILVPVMYGRAALEKLLGSVPDDFEAVSTEFWVYVATRLQPLKRKVDVVYAQSSSTPEGEGDRLLKTLQGGGIPYHCVEDPILTAETHEWLKLVDEGSNPVAKEFLEETLRDRDAYAVTVIDRTLEDGQMGVLFLDPTRRLPFPENVRVIRMCPFDPLDYLNRSIAKRKLANRGA